MDEFGVLTERYGLKPQGKSVPMAEAKRSTSANGSRTRNFGSNSGINSKSSSSYSSHPGRNSNSINTSFVNDHDILFQSSASRKPKDSGGFDNDDFFGYFQESAKQPSNSGNKSSFDYDSIFSNSGNSNNKFSPVIGNIDDDIFASMPGFKVSENVNDDMFGSFVSSAKQNTAVDDLLGEFGAKPKSSNLNGSGDFRKNASDVNDLLPGFGGSSPPSNWYVFNLINWLF